MNWIVFYTWSLFVIAQGQHRAPPGVNPSQYQQPPPHQQQQFQGQQFQGQQPQFQGQQQFQGQPPQQFQGQPPQQFQGQPPQQFQGQPPPQQFQGQPPQQQQQFQGQPPPQQQFQQPPPQQNQINHGGHHGGHGQKKVLHKDVTQEKDHMKEHMDVPIDTSNMSEQELQFHYFKMHDADGNGKLDGCELVKSLIHWHDDEIHEGHDHSEPPIFNDKQLSTLIDPVLREDDRNNDGMIDYAEFISAQIRTERGEKPVIQVSV